MLQLDKCALAIVDVQKGFDDLSYRSPTLRAQQPCPPGQRLRARGTGRHERARHPDQPLRRDPSGDLMTADEPTRATVTP
jgi:hypothetical protein